MLGADEIRLCKGLLKLDPRRYGFRGRYLGFQAPPRSMKAVRGQTYRIRNIQKKIPVQYLPSEVYAAWVSLNRAMKKEIGRDILVESGYRSPAYQLFNVLFHLAMYNWNVRKTLRRVAMPGYSEHGNKHTALDFITVRGVPQEDNLFAFAHTPEYRWLTKNASRFGFILSYPKGNKHGIMFEPWHWRYVGVK